MQMARINGEDLDALVLSVFADVSNQGQESIKPAKLYEALRKERWDIDDNDIRSAMSRLFAEKWVMLTFDGYLKLIEQPNHNHITT